MNTEANISISVERERLTNRVLDATTLPEIEAARAALRDWIRRHPEDAGMCDAFEQLAMMQEIAEAERSAVPAPLVDGRKAA